MITTDTPAYDAGRRVLTVRAGRFARDGGHLVSGLVGLRPAAIGLVLVVVILAAAVAAMALGSYRVLPGDVVAALFGQGTTKDQLVVVEWRLPRVIMAVVVGAFLAMAGAVFQSLTRNPLGSPDIIGFNAGAYTGALGAILFLGGGFASTAVGSFAGGLATAAVVYLLAFRNGIQGFRLIIVGIGIASMLSAFNTWLILKAELQLAMVASVWGAGSLNNADWERTALLTVFAVVLLPLLMALSRPLQALELGDDAAAAQGVATERATLMLMVVGVALTAVCTAAAGPISFIALAAPQIARRLTGSGRVSLVSSGLVGAALLLLSDLVAQHALPGIQMPVGIVTVTVGGGYLVWLLFREAKKS
ncbi:FecCD family ABC transporter permease [Brachybacterium sp. AOP24-D1-21]|uniref:FecCD family ABC transporter permease n=1 Tax=Brachybacterium sp. AOP24-D1-21 TaxID=3457711 RepID=UPI0040333637